jgi:hypothetical protein
MVGRVRAAVLAIEIEESFPIVLGQLAMSCVFALRCVLPGACWLVCNGFFFVIGSIIHRHICIVDLDSSRPLV